MVRNLDDAKVEQVCSEKRMEVKIPRPFGKLNQPTNDRSTDRPGHREVPLPIIWEEKAQGHLLLSYRLIFETSSSYALKFAVELIYLEVLIHDKKTTI